jgi:hypothetical protein
MSQQQTKAHDLLNALGLRIVKHGSGGRYPCGEPGPAQGFRFWATFTEGQFKFGVQANPKRELAAGLIARLRRLDFVPSPNGMEAFVFLGPTMGNALDQARATMPELSRALAQ